MAQEINIFAKTLDVFHSEKPVRVALKKIIEGLLFSSNEPLSAQKIKEVLESHYAVKVKDVLEMLYELQKEYFKENRAIQIDEIAGGFQLRTHADIAPFLEILHQHRRSEKLSKAATEVLAIIAYRSPITRSDIEGIRGVDCSGALYSLLDRQLIEVVGRLEVLGRPCQYGVTKKFLQHYGLNDVKDLCSPAKSNDCKI